MILGIKRSAHTGSFRFDFLFGSDGYATSSGSFNLESLSDNRTKHSFGQGAIIVIATAI